MSENVMSSGIMVPLVNKLTNEMRDELSETLWERESSVYVNYEGTMVYTDYRGDEYGIKFGISQNFDQSEFDILKEFNIEIQPDMARPYSCYWYNGTDSDMDDLTLDKFKEYTNQE
jgi:hypothetical protein